MRRILIANDVKLTLELECSFLQREGFTVHSAGSGREALELVRQIKPDLIVLDYDMPLLPGVEVCSAVRADAELSATPVLIVCDHDEVPVRERCRKAGCTGFVSRTAGADGLLEAVAEALKVGVRGRDRVPVDLQVQAGAHYQNFNAHARDLSAGGLQLDTPEPIDVGLPVVVQFRLPNGEKAIMATVRVTRCSPGPENNFLVAACFESIDEDARRRLEEFLQKNQSPASISLQIER
jgi:CheY-like chemotaxis protein